VKGEVVARGHGADVVFCPGKLESGVNPKQGRAEVAVSDEEV
jgi:hypothetical protein